jgi:hypothetical protein
LGHYKFECPLNKRKSNNFQSNKKSFSTTWDESEEPTNEDQQENLFLMANSDNQESRKGLGTWTEDAQDI